VPIQVKRPCLLVGIFEMERRESWMYVMALSNRKDTLSLHGCCVGVRKVDLKREIMQRCKLVRVSWPDMSSSLNLSIVCICKLLLRNSKLEKFFNRKQASMQDRSLSFFFNFYISLHSTKNWNA
jgi:hypothetical protein